jgi:hypothetical protein
MRNCGTRGDRSLSNRTTRKRCRGETHELIFTFHGGERVDERTTVRLYRGGNLSSTAEVGGTEREMDEEE